MPSERVQILSWFQRCDIEQGDFSFESYLEKAVIEALGKNAFDAKQYVSAHTNRLWNFLLDENAKNSRKGITPLFSTRDFQKKIGYFPPYLDSSDKRSRFIRRGLASRPVLLKRIDALNSRRYEALGCLASILSGADRHLLTPPGNEGGIDFFSRIRQPANNHVFSGSYAPIRVIGQSKKYTSKVTVSKVREFVTAIDQAKHRYKRAGELVPDWFSSMQGPIIGWMIAHSGFQSGAADLAKDQGIILSDSSDIAEILSLSKKFYPNLSVTERAENLRIEVDEILSGT